MWNKLIERAFEISQNPDKALIGVGAVGWLISMFAQITAVKTNESLSPEKKKILLAQETADGITNTLLYLGVTSILTFFAKKKVDSGKIISEELMDMFNSQSQKTGKKFAELTKEIAATGQLKDVSSETIKTFTNFRSGVAIIATIIGSVLSTNIATPIIRNYMGNYYQKKAKSIEEKANPIQTQPIYSTLKTPTPPAFTKSNTFATFTNITKV